MKLLRDHQGRPVRLTDERRDHILEHPELSVLEHALEETLTDPQIVMESRSDPHVRLYYRRYLATPVGAKFMCVVVKTTDFDAFVITAYLTDRVKRGTQLWASKA